MSFTCIVELTSLLGSLSLKIAEAIRKIKTLFPRVVHGGATHRHWHWHWLWLLTGNFFFPKGAVDQRTHALHDPWMIVTLLGKSIHAMLYSTTHMSAPLTTSFYFFVSTWISHHLCFFFSFLSWIVPRVSYSCKCFCSCQIL